MLGIGRAGLCTAALGVLVSLAGCGSDDDSKKTGADRPEQGFAADSPGGATKCEAPEAHAKVSFARHDDYKTGPSPQSVAIGDLNADGRPDLAVADEDNDTGVSVLFAEGAQGKFAPKKDLKAGGHSSSVAIGDLNGDKRPDLAVANDVQNNITVLLAEGKPGEFAAQPALNTGPQPASVAIGDLSGDGRRDLVVANHGADTVSVFLADGAQGEFADKDDYKIDPAPSSVVITNVNADDRPDLAVATEKEPSVALLFADGAPGKFVRKGDEATDAPNAAVAPGDLDHNDHEDLAAASGNRISLLMNNAPSSSVRVGGSLDSVAVEDLNADGRPDIAAGNVDAENVVVLLAAGKEGAFLKPGVNEFQDVGGSANSVAIGDLNGDARPDIASANQGLGADVNNVSVLLNTTPEQGCAPPPNSP